MHVCDTGYIKQPLVSNDLISQDSINIEIIKKFLFKIKSFLFFITVKINIGNNKAKNINALMANKNIER